MCVRVREFTSLSHSLRWLLHLQRDSNLVKNRVVITGVGVVSPLGLDSKTTWKGLLAGKSGVGRVTAFDPDGLETTIAAEVDGFDPEAYVGRKQARRMDRFVQLGAAATLEAVQHARLQIARKQRRARRGDGRQWHRRDHHPVPAAGVLHTKGPSRISPFLVPMMLPDMASGQISMMLGAKGPNYAAVSACSSGADALGLAFEAIRRGEVDVVVAGGAEAAICPIGLAGFNACQALSRRNDEPQKASRPFDAERDCFVLGEGAAVLVLESMDSAVKRDADAISEIVGYGSTADAHHITKPAPEGEGGARAMKQALQVAGLQPEEIEYINAHGTSTPLNDKYETMAMKSVFGEEAYSIPVSSTKSMTGHLLGAGGALEAQFV